MLDTRLPAADYRCPAGCVGPRRRLLGCLVGLGVLVALAVAPIPQAAAESGAAHLGAPIKAAGRLPQALAERLTPAQQRVYLEWRKARDAHERRYRAYWHAVERKRSGRRAKRKRNQAFAASDYVTAFPPRYQGPELPASIAEIVEGLEERERPARRPEQPSVSDFLRHAKRQFGFVPRRATERQFKWNYASEALRVGLTKQQVVRVYALETGGRGTYDTQAGVNPVTGRGRPISSALGYAQLLNANSAGEIVKHGKAFAKRLMAMAEAPGVSPARAAELKKKARILRRMLQAARSVPFQWSAHRRFGRTPRGLGIHALNLDADIGPWMQVLKLKALKDAAARHGHAELTGAQIELMNLAGPGTGLEMMTPLGRKMPTPNFFSRLGYSRNPVVHDKTAAELLAALDKHMETFLKKPGAVEFARIFDEVSRRMARR